MKKYIAWVTIIVFAGFFIWQTALTHQANANVQIVLSAMGQAPTSTWRPVIRIPKVVELLKDGQVVVFKQQKLEMSSDLSYAQSQPIGFRVAVKDPDALEGYVMIPKDDYIIELQADIAEVDVHIAALESN